MLKYSLNLLFWRPNLIKLLTILILKASLETEKKEFHEELIYTTTLPWISLIFPSYSTLWVSF